MNAELHRAEAEDWTQWERQIVNGVFPLRRLLGGSAHGAVFLTEHKSKGLADAAIKLVRADASQAQALLSQWQAAAALSHPHLVRLFDVGRCQLGGHGFVFVVMEHADQTLAGILRHRALNAEEVQELLVPTLDALTFLHRRNVAHGQLKPSNLLAVGDQLKLASDTLRPAGHQGMSTANDIWSLGMTLAEALTQRAPARSGQRLLTNLPDGLPAPLVDTVRRCLSTHPSDRPTAVELRGVPEIAPEVTPPQKFDDRPLAVPDRPAAIAGVIAGGLLILLAVWIGLRVTSNSQADLQPRIVPAPTKETSSVTTQPADSKPATTVAAPSAQSALPPVVLHEARPDVPQNALNKIQGRIFVMVRVLVDPSGNVIGALMEDPGRSKYFARLAENAARKWRFIPSDKQRPRVWILRFAFTRDGVTTRVIEQ